MSGWVVYDGVMQGEAMHETDVLLVGAGPIGLELAASFHALGVDYVHLEAGQIAQTISWYPKQARFFSSPERIAIAGVSLVTPDQTKATREQYLAYLRSVAIQHGLRINTFEKVERIERDHLAGHFTAYARRGEEPSRYLSRHVVLAVGDMHHPQMLHIPGEELPHVSHYFDEPNVFFGRRLLVVGGRNSAVEAAMRCHRAGAQVTLSYRGANFDAAMVKYWLQPEIESLIKHGAIKWYPHTRPVRITPRCVQLLSTAVPPGPEVSVDADFVLLLTGYGQDTTLFEAAGVALVGENRAPQVDDATMMTNVPGLYVAGTAVAGTQKTFRLFIENCHPHVTRIVRSITGQEPPPGLVNQAAAIYGLPES